MVKTTVCGTVNAGSIPTPLTKPRPCGDPLGLCLYIGPHEGYHKVANIENVPKMLKGKVIVFRLNDDLYESDLP